MNSEISKLYDLMLRLHQADQLPLKWQKIEEQYGWKWDKPLPKRINLLLANGARDETNEGPLYLRLGKGIYDLLTQVVINLNQGKETRLLFDNLTDAIQESQSNDTLIIYPNHNPYQERLVFQHGLTIKGRSNRQNQVIKSLELNSLAMQTNQSVLLERLTFKDSIESQKKTQVLEVKQGQLEFNDCALNYEAPLSITVHEQASLVLKNCHVRAKNIKLDIQGSLRLEGSELRSLSQSGIELKTTGQFHCHNSAMKSQMTIK